MELKNIKNIFLIGIGGIGMSALARYFKYLDKIVVGYDKTPSALTSELIASGIDIHFEDNISLIPDDFYLENTLVIITPAVPISHSQWQYFLERNYIVKKRSEVLGLITNSTFSFGVAGTHGKTTTTAILGHILYQSGVDVTAFVGGIVEGYNTNLIGNGKTVTVVEADEFDRSFLKLSPDMACITSTDADHLDIYGNAESIQESFAEFAAKVEDKSNLFIANGINIEGQTTGFNDLSDYQVLNKKIVDGSYFFDIKTPTETIENLRFSLPGNHNLHNALMAVAMAKKYGVSNDNIKSSLLSFPGIKRRFSYQIKTYSKVYIDDYAHHPTEINAVYQAVHELYPNDKVLAIFQPHLFSRTKDFADDFAKSLSQFDDVLLMEIYPARELPIDGITSSWLLEKIENPNKKLVSKENLIHEIKNSTNRIIVTIGAGDIGEMVSTIKFNLEN
ncbi:MAG: UDP-N-acetylmuramate--alanine ligase [Bacteroidota bacterium]|jgi:UDP-N-acetylmuramate--alanine ligase